VRLADRFENILRSASQSTNFAQVFPFQIPQAITVWRRKSEPHS
jgi:hypothetical protein